MSYNLNDKTLNYSPVNGYGAVAPFSESGEGSLISIEQSVQAPPDSDFSTGSAEKRLILKPGQPFPANPVFRLPKSE